MMSESSKEGLKSIIENVSTTVTDALRKAEGQIGALTGKKLFPVDVVEYGDSFLVLASLPGVLKEHVEVAMEAGKLTIRVTQDPAEEAAGGTYRCRERTVGAGARTIELPEASDAEDVQAVLKDGVLRLRLQKAARKQARKVNIE